MRPSTPPAEALPASSSPGARPWRVLAPHPRRTAILGTLQAEPGLCFRALMRRTGFGAGSLELHLRRLVRFDLVWTVRHGPRVLHFAAPRPDGPRRVREGVEQHGLDAVDRSILAWSREVGPRMQRAFFDAPPARGLPRSSVPHRLGRLVRQGFLVTARSGRSLLYSYVE